MKYDWSSNAVSLNAQVICHTALLVLAYKAGQRQLAVKKQHSMMGMMQVDYEHRCQAYFEPVDLEQI